MDRKKEEEEVGEHQAKLLSSSVKRPRVEDLVPVKSYISKKPKKKKPLGMKAFFQTAKNFQGFPIHLCRYEASIGKHVYTPKNYGELTKGFLWRDLSFCPSCQLQPCLMVEYQDDIQSTAHDLRWEQMKAEEEGTKACTNLDIVKKAEKQAMKHFRKHFGREYMKRCNNRVPDCVISGTHHFGDDEFWFA